MPVASPIIEIISVTKKESSTKRPTSAVAPSAVTMASAASTSGTKAATTAPNSTSRIRRAMGTPTRSPCSISRTLSSLVSNATLASPTRYTSNASAPPASSTSAKRPPMLSLA